MDTVKTSSPSLTLKSTGHGSIPEAHGQHVPIMAAADASSCMAGASAADASSTIAGASAADAMAGASSSMAGASMADASSSIVAGASMADAFFHG